MGCHSADRLAGWVAGSLEGLGVPSADARVVAESLVEAELEGHSSHGLIRLPLLLRRLRQGLIEPRPTMRLSGGAAALLDADNGLGPVAGVRAAAAAADRAWQHGVGVVAVRRSNHLGSLSYYVRRLAGDGLVGLAFSNTPPALAPPGARRPLLGTNPIAAGFPAEKGPVIVDLATAQVSRGRILEALRRGEAIPEGWALDGEGHPTTDARQAIDGSLAPLGGAKGFALAVMVEALTGVLAGAGVGPAVAGTYEASDRPSDVGHCFCAIDPEAVAPGFAGRMERLAAEIRASGGRMPGDRAAADRARRLREGIEVSETLEAEISEIVGRPLGAWPLGS
jgi:(2R)-3-sulfolactate dehydrogenase (NADP+)